jgi:hypothetical protein
MRLHSHCLGLPVRLCSVGRFLDSDGAILQKGQDRGAIEEVFACPNQRACTSLGSLGGSVPIRRCPKSHSLMSSWSKKHGLFAVGLARPPERLRCQERERVFSRNPVFQEAEPEILDLPEDSTTDKPGKNSWIQSPGHFQPFKNMNF